MAAWCGPVVDPSNALDYTVTSATGGDTVDEVTLAEGVDLHVAQAWIALRNIEHLIETGRLPKGRLLRTTGGGTIDTTTLRIGIAKRIGLEMNVVPGRPVLVRRCWCGVFFVTQRQRVCMCDEHMRLRVQTVCVGSEKACPTGAIPPRTAFTPQEIARRKGRPWRCRVCALVEFSTVVFSGPLPCSADGCPNKATVQSSKNAAHLGRARAFCKKHLGGPKRPKPMPCAVCGNRATRISASNARRKGSDAYCAKHRRDAASRRVAPAPCCVCGQPATRNTTLISRSRDGYKPRCERHLMRRRLATDQEIDAARAAASQTACAGMGAPCPTQSKPAREAFSVSNLRAREWRPWVCRECWLRSRRR